jgi:hypothetical protein
MKRILVDEIVEYNPVESKVIDENTQPDPPPIQWLVRDKIIKCNGVLLLITTI